MSGCLRPDMIDGEYPPPSHAYLIAFERMMASRERPLLWDQYVRDGYAWVITWINRILFTSLAPFFTTDIPRWSLAGIALRVALIVFVVYQGAALAALAVNHYQDMYWFIRGAVAPEWMPAMPEPRAAQTWFVKGIR